MSEHPAFTLAGLTAVGGTIGFLRTRSMVSQASEEHARHDNVSCPVDTAAVVATSALFDLLTFALTPCQSLRVRTVPVPMCYPKLHTLNPHHFMHAAFPRGRRRCRHRLRSRRSAH